MGWSIGSIAGMTLGAMVATGAAAMPLAPLVGLQNAGVIRVADGCGPYGHRSHYGYCKPNGPPAYGYGGGYGGGYGYGPPHIYGGPGYGGERPRCFIRETYDGPRRICRY